MENNKLTMVKPIKTVDEAWNSIKKFFGKESEDAEKVFRTRYSLNEIAHNTLADRYTFFLNAIKRDPEVMDQYGKDMGEDYLDERLLYALTNCINKIGQIDTRVQSLMTGFPMNYNRRKNISFPEAHKNTLEFTCQNAGVCIIEGQLAPYMESCIKDDHTILLLPF